jgi:DNA-binding transcriptional ArsR family regulator
LVTTIAAADRLKALGHPVRLAIVQALAEESACCCSDVCSRLPLAQSTVSQHLKVLKEAGLVSFRRDGVRSSYVLNREAFAALRADLERITALVSSPSCCARESDKTE